MDLENNSKSKNTVIAIIPAYNEEKNIRKVIQECQKYVHYIIVVDDGSEDNTLEVAKNLNVIIVRNKQNSGKTEALKKGFSRGLKEDAEIFVLLDADGQHNPSEIPQFLEKIQQGFDLVVGARRFNNKVMPRIRIIANSISSFLVSLVCGFNVEDSQSGYRAIRKDLLKSITLTSSQFQIDTETIIKAVKCGFKVGFIPIETIYRTEAKSTINQFIDPLKFIILLIKLVFWKCNSSE